MWKYFVVLLFICFTNLIIFGQDQDEVKSCSDCHETLMGNDNLHPPADEDCEYCHEPTGKQHPGDNGRGFKLTDDIPGLCYMCHEENDAKYIHAPVEAGECVFCHSPHSSNNPYLLLANPVASLCFECHDQELAENKYNHQPVEDGDCQNCHHPHQSKYRSLLKYSMPKLCFECHEETGSQMEERRLHAPFEDDCRNCHLVHGAPEKNLLAQKPPMLCYDCHDVNESIKNQLVVHGALSVKKTCINCHSPHASSVANLLQKENVQLCLSCHNKTIKTETKKISNIKQKLKNAKSVHDAIEFDGCSGCHSSHSSVFPSLLKDMFPSGHYVKAQVDSFALCFSCHDTEMIELKLSKTATNFRNGDQNLHYLHINGEKGRSCKECHDMHASPNEHLMRENVAFGEWKMPLIYKIGENGGSCLTGCHSEKIYSRE